VVAWRSYGQDGLPGKARAVDGFCTASPRQHDTDRSIDATMGADGVSIAGPVTVRMTRRRGGGSAEFLPSVTRATADLSGGNSV
jgi:hypothetical protein